MTLRSVLRVLVLVVVMGGLAGGGYYWWRSQNLLAADAPLVLQGNVEVRQVNLGFKVAGRIERLSVDEGDMVKMGQSLGHLESVYFEESLAQLRAQRDQMAANLDKLINGNRAEDIAQAAALVAEREATLTNANVTLDRAKQLYKSTYGTQKDRDDAEAAQRTAEAQLNSARQALRLMQIGNRKEDIDAGKAQLAGAEAAIAIAERQLADADLKAPSDGVVLTRVHEIGAIINAGDPVFVLSLTTPVWVRTYVSEPDLPRIKPGMEVEMTPDSQIVGPLKGRIGFVSSTAEFTPKTVETRELRTALVFRLRIVVDDPKGVLRQGMPMTVTVPQSAPATPGREQNQNGPAVGALAP